MTELCDLTAVELRTRLRRRDISPREILDSCKARIERINPVLNAIVATDWEAVGKAADLAGQEIAEGEESKPVLGLPVGIKDLNDTAGLRTTYGSQLYADHGAGRRAVFFRELLTEAVLFRIHDEVDVTLSIEGHVFRSMARDGLEPQSQEEVAQGFGVRGRVFDELEAIGPHRIVEKI